MENNAVTLSLYQFSHLIDLETRVNVLIERLDNDESLDKEDVLRIIGTDSAIEVAEKIKKHKRWEHNWEKEVSRICDKE